MTKQSMGDLVTQCEAWGLVTRESDERDARARRIRFTPAGLAWLQAFHDAVSQAEAEFREEVGDDIATVVALGLEAYAGGGSLGKVPARAAGRILESWELKARISNSQSAPALQETSPCAF